MNDTTMMANDPPITIMFDDVVCVPSSCACNP